MITHIMLYKGILCQTLPLAFKLKTLTQLSGWPQQRKGTRHKPCTSISVRNTWRFWFCIQGAYPAAGERIGTWIWDLRAKQPIKWLLQCPEPVFGLCYSSACPHWALVEVRLSRAPAYNMHLADSSHFQISYLLVEKKEKQYSAVQCTMHTITPTYHLPANFLLYFTLKGSTEVGAQEKINYKDSPLNKLRLLWALSQLSLILGPCPQPAQPVLARTLLSKCS